LEEARPKWYDGRATTHGKARPLRTLNWLNRNDVPTSHKLLPD
jgi:hypothetical protein